MTWLQFTRVRSVKRYYLTGTTASRKVITLKVNFTQSSKAARADREARGAQDPKMMAVRVMPRTPSTFFIPAAAHAWAYQFVQDWDYAGAWKSSPREGHRGQPSRRR